MRLKVGRCVVRHSGEEYGENDVFEVDDKSGAFLIENADVEETDLPVTSVDEVGKDTVVVKTKAPDAIDIEALTEDQINDMKQSELAKVASALKLDTPDKKSDTLRPAILDALCFCEEVIDLDKLDEAGLRELAEAEEIEVPEDADEETLRDIIEKALYEE